MLYATTIKVVLSHLIVCTFLFLTGVSKQQNSGSVLGVGTVCKLRRQRQNHIFSVSETSAVVAFCSRWQVEKYQVSEAITASVMMIFFTVLVFLKQIFHK